ncbi:hypothetical protein L1887_04961 [Cichorium endivia]|nr:hypothetical protein L1887_04961 [Cichorium endivia]
MKKIKISIQQHFCPNSLAHTILQVTKEEEDSLQPCGPSLHLLALYGFLADKNGGFVCTLGQFRMSFLFII